MRLPGNSLPSSQDPDVPLHRRIRSNLSNILVLVSHNVTRRIQVTRRHTSVGG